MEPIHKETFVHKEELLLTRVYAFLLKQARKRNLSKSGINVTNEPKEDTVSTSTTEPVDTNDYLLTATRDMLNNPVHDIIAPGGYEHGRMDHNQ